MLDSHNASHETDVSRDMAPNRTPTERRRNDLDPLCQLATMRATPGTDRSHEGSPTSGGIHGSCPAWVFLLFEKLTSAYGQFRSCSRRIEGDL